MSSGGRRAVIAVLAMLLVAGCGAGSSSEADGPGKAGTTVPAPPKNYTLQDLAAALPKVEDVPGADEIYLRCPEDKKRCTSYEKGTAVVTGDLEAASPVGAEQVQSQATPLDFFAVHGQRHADVKAAAKIAEVGSTDTAYVGTYEITQDDGTTSRGKGTVEDLTIDQWSGIISQRTEVSSDSTTDEGLLVASIRVSSGRTSAIAFVSVSAAGREPRAAVEIAEGLVRDYLERLG